MMFLGAILDTCSNTVELPPVKASGLISQRRKVATLSFFIASHCLKLLETLSATIFMVKWALWQMRTIQVGFLKQWKSHSTQQRIRLSPAMKQSLGWWMTPLNLSNCHLPNPGPLMVITYDALAVGWEEHLNGFLAQGQWKNRRAVFNAIKLKSAFQALKAFLDQIKGANVHL